MGFVVETKRGVRNYYGARTSNKAPGNDGYARGNEKCITLYANSGTVEFPTGDAGIRVPKGAYVTRVYPAANSSATASKTFVFTDGAASPTTILTLSTDANKNISGAFSNNGTYDKLIKAKGTDAGVMTGYTGKIQIFYMTDDGNEQVNKKP